MMKAKEGDRVRVHYTGSLEDGSVFDSSVDQAPLEFTIGGGEVIPGFESSVIGMEEGSENQVTLTPDDAYGPHKEDLIMQVDRSQLPNDITPQPGMVLQASTQNGDVTHLVVTDADDDTVTLDANHPLAGKILSLT